MYRINRTLNEHIEQTVSKIEGIDHEMIEHNDDEPEAEKLRQVQAIYCANLRQFRRLLALERGEAIIETLGSRYTLP